MELCPRCNQPKCICEWEGLPGAISHDDIVAWYVAWKGQEAREIRELKRLMELEIPDVGGTDPEE